MRQPDEAISPRNQEPIHASTEMTDQIQGDRGPGAILPMAAGQRSKPVANTDDKADYCALISGLPICFGLVTLMMTIGAAPHEARMSGAMRTYGVIAILCGIFIAAGFWCWRTVRRDAPRS